MKSTLEIVQEGDVSGAKITEEDSSGVVEVSVVTDGMRVQTTIQFTPKKPGWGRRLLNHLKDPTGLNS